jgi:hypothetical protein
LSVWELSTRLKRSLEIVVALSSVVRIAFRDASISSEIASNRPVVEFVGVEGAIVERVGGRGKRNSDGVVNREKTERRVV